MSTLFTKKLETLLVAAACAAVVGRGDETAKRGGLVLQFDDGWTSWRALVAPELAKVGGRATCFVNNQYIHSGRITFDDLRALQNEFKWEIGSHGYTHVNPVRYVQQHGLKTWEDEQFVRALGELRGAGLTVVDFVFPFNVYSPELGQAVLAGGMGSYRRADPFALAAGRRADGSLPGTSIDLTRYVPLSVLKEWVAMAHARDQLLFLYGHRVLPDSAFVTGRVARVSAHELVAENGLVLPQDEDVVLVPDLSRRGLAGSIGGLSLEEGRRIRTAESGPDLTRLTAPGAVFLIGPTYGTRLSDFAELIRIAAEQLTFYTVSDVVSEKTGIASPKAGETQ